jgi:EmrB/QacA subfamily drug resistance transporter
MASIQGEAPRAGEDIGHGRRRWKVLAITSLASFMVFLDATIVNIAFPAIHRTFPSTSQTALSWVLNTYNVGFAALLLPCGRIADIIGRRRVFFAGLGVFTTSSVLCGLAPSPLDLDISRTMQAVGAAMLVPAALALVLPEFPLSMRATAVGIWGAAAAVAASAGPSLGSTIVQYAGWRWAFLINAPIGLVAWLLGRRVLVEARARMATRWPDPVGVVLLTAGMAVLAMGIVEGNDWGWSDPRIVLSFVAAPLMVAGCVVRSLSHPAPAVMLSMYRDRTIALANAGTLLFAMAVSAALLGNVLFLTSVWHYSVLRAGLAVTPPPVMAALCAPLAGWVADRFGHRIVLVLGALTYTVGMLLYRTQVGVDAEFVNHWLPAAVVSGIGLGLTLPTLGAAAVAPLSAASLAGGSAVMNMSRQIGFVLGIAILMALLGTPAPAQALSAFGRSWDFCAIAAAVTGMACVGLTMVARRQEPGAELVGAVPGVDTSPLNVPVSVGQPVHLVG